jgi:hypothetical protein
VTIPQGLMLLAAAYVGLSLIDLLAASQRTCSICCRRGAVYRGDWRDPNDHRCRAHRVKR